MTPNICIKCHRVHGGICGIPPGVTLGFGARAIKSATAKESIKLSQKEGALKTTGLQRLQGMLEWGEAEKVKVLEMLKILPPELEEFTKLLERLDKLDNVLLQLKQKEK